MASKEPYQVPTHPLFLHHSDELNMLLTSQPLDHATTSPRVV